MLREAASLQSKGYGIWTHNGNVYARKSDDGIKLELHSVQQIKDILVSCGGGMEAVRGDSV